MTDQPPAVPPTDDQASPPLDRPPLKQTERPHPLTPLIRGWIVFVVILFAIGRQLIPDESGRSNIGQLVKLGVGWILLGVGAIVVLAAAAGFLSWYFTRYVIDDEELRVETGWLAKRSRRIAFQRVQSVDIIQPLAARLFGLVELRIEAGAGDSRTVLRYLTRKQATQFRDYLLARAHGDQVTVAGSSQLPEASAFTDLSAAERTLVTINPGLLVLGLVLSTEFAISVAVLIIVVVVSSIAGSPVVGLAGLIPMFLTIVSLIGRRVTAQFNYTLAESSRGLRISRGLTNLTSQSLPLNRIQGVRIVQPLLWRLLGLTRVDVDVLGYGANSEQGENNTDVSNILLPIARDEQVRTALSRVLPRADLESIELHPSPKRARAIRWFDGWTLRYGWNDAVIISRHGFFDRTTDVVPHAKTQSVRITQGPLQKALQLASVHVDTPKGPVNLVALHLDPPDARRLALEQLDRARNARRAALPGSGTVADEAVLQRFGLTGVAPLGSGGESIVYPLGDDHVLRVYRSGHESATRMIEQLAPAYRAFSQVSLGFRTPVIVESGQVAGRTYSVDRRMPGQSLDGWLPTAPAEQRQPVLDQYLRAAAAIQRLPLPAPEFARLFGDRLRRFDSLGALLEDQLRTAARQTAETIDQELPAAAVEQVIGELHQRRAQPALVHGDYFPGNVMVGEQNGAMIVTGVADFSPHTLAADPLMDVAGAIWLIGLAGHPGADDDQRFVYDRAITLYGGEQPADLIHWLDVYRRYYAVYYAPDPAIFPISMRHLAS
ncbi:PH domain-containing protein [Microlunatus soli]|uniref:Putative membrane protein n=1 Tax=Microlunatus soli TaxID=630515 RepID=A0A1H1VCV1_9ACTN|nr:PH domain-containing protein [Microlunatus soli]SDS82612.1 putative membrane protein [Microlunatus soli]